MKKLLTLLFSTAALLAIAGTPFYLSFKNSDGSAQTNNVLMRAFPPTANGFTVYGTNVIWGAAYLTNTPNASGFFSNSVYPNQYQFYIPAMDASFYAVIPDTNGYLSLALYLTNAPVTSVPFPGFVTSTYASVTNALRFVPATNNPVSVTNVYVSSIATITNGSGYITNLSYVLTTNIINYQSR